LIAAASKPNLVMPLRSLLDVPAPAKLNLFLHVIGRRDDGYHLLQSPFVLIDWADTLHFERRDDGALARHDLGAALPTDDLCLRAARALQTASGTRLGADISIDKQVPWGAGMGGGSSDAATTLLALNRLWRLGWPRQRLLALAATIGADVPFFVGGRNAFVEGIGEQLTPIDWSPRHYAVVKPAAAIETRAIFEHPALVRDTYPVILAGFLADTAPEEFGRNDLQAAAEICCAEVSQANRWLEARFGNSRMTGSGSAVFARMAEMTGAGSRPQATFPAEELPPGWVGRMCRSLQAHPLLEWAA
jgi:4-diphosphocytidyl-2-C-methyl-D-erythritol kinase